MNLNDISTCLVCQSHDYKVVFAYNEPDPYEHAIGITSEGYWRQWVQCTKCGLYYSRYSRAETALDAIYISAYRDGNASWRVTNTEEMFQRIISLPPEQSETKYRVNWIKSQLHAYWSSDFIEKDPPPYKLLDIGGATGVLAHEFRDDNWLPHVIDPSEEGAFIQEKVGIPYKKEFYQPGLFDDKFDLITMFCVIEHVRDPISLLKLIQEDMKSHSLIYIEVPEAAYFKHRPANDDIFNSCHYWIFSPNTLMGLLDQCGYEVFSMLRTRTLRGAYTLMLMGGLK
jgi:hypothetical protein